MRHKQELQHGNCINAYSVAENKRQRRFLVSFLFSPGCSVIVLFECGFGVDYVHCSTAQPHGRSFGQRLHAEEGPRNKAGEQLNPGLAYAQPVGRGRAWLGADRLRHPITSAARSLRKCTPVRFDTRHARAAHRSAAVELVFAAQGRGRPPLICDQYRSAAAGLQRAARQNECLHPAAVPQCGSGGSFLPLGGSAYNKTLDAYDATDEALDAYCGCTGSVRVPADNERRQPVQRIPHGRNRAPQG